MTKDQEIRFLKRQLNRERRKNRLLRKRLQKQNVQTPEPAKDMPKSFSARANEAYLYRHNRYSSYLAELIRTNSIYRLWEKYVRYFRRLGLVSTTFRIITYSFLFIQTGTVFFVAFLCFLIALPVFATVSLGIYLVSCLLAHRDNQAMRTLCQSEHVYVFFPTKAQEFSRGNFWKGNVLSLAAREHSCVIIVSPYFFSGRGFSQKDRFYFNYRNETDRIYWIRKHYFFSLRRHVLAQTDARVILIY